MRRDTKWSMCIFLELSSLLSGSCATPRVDTSYIDNLRNELKLIDGEKMGPFQNRSLSPAQKKIDNDITRVETWANDLIDEVMLRQEEILGIKYIGYPKISAMPIKKDDAAYYNPKLNEIIIDSEINNLGTIKRVLAHELGHFYVDTRSESLGLGSWPDFTGLDAKEIYLYRLISEGIASYFEELDIENYSFRDNEWPASILRFNLNSGPERTKYIYEAGLSLVGPVLDVYPKKAIDEFLKNLPNEEDFGYQQKYRIKILEKIGE